MNERSESSPAQALASIVVVFTLALDLCLRRLC